MTELPLLRRKKMNQQNKIYDYIVVGLGAFGLPTLVSLKKKGYEVLGLDQDRPGGERSLSAGEVRIFREAYVDNPFFVSLAKRSKEHWLYLEALYNDIYKEVGLTTFYKDSTSFLKDEKIYKEFQIPYQRVGLSHQRGDLYGLSERGALLLSVSRYYEILLSQLKKIDYHLQEKVVSIQEAETITVETTKHTYQTRHLVVSAGQWSKTLINPQYFKRPLICQRSPIFWLENSLQLKEVQSYITDKGHFFVVPSFDFNRIKIFNYYPVAEYEDPFQHDYHIQSGDEELLLDFVQEYLNISPDQVIKKEVSLYFSTPDDQFYIDQVGEYQNIKILTGGSGHAFKFSPLMGELSL